MSTEVDNDLLVEVECPICTNYMHPPIRQCVSGHSFCQTCHAKVSSCPTCRMPKSLGRNYTLERLHGKLVFPCKSKLEGCNFIDVGSKIRLHEEECVFGKVQCPLKVINDCAWFGSIDFVIEHCHQEHPNNVFITDKQKLTCTNFRQGGTGKSSYYIMFQVKDELFKCSWEVDFRSGLMMWCVHHLGTPELSRNFSFEVSFDDKLILRAPCPPPMAQPETNMLKMVSSIITHVDMLKKYCMDDDLIYTIRIIDSTS